MERIIYESLGKMSDVFQKLDESGRDPNIFGRKLGQSGFIGGTEGPFNLGLMCLLSYNPEVQNTYLRGFAHSAAISDLGLSERDLTKEQDRLLLEKSENLLYQYLESLLNR